MASPSFQSTRPVKGATGLCPYLHAGGVVSIHAPREGRDRAQILAAAEQALFQSTRPVKGATKRVLQRVGKVMFQSTRPVKGATGRLGLAEFLGQVSIHAPREGRDKWEQTRQPTDGVSIHAPREGRDFRDELDMQPWQGFNPRAP